MIALSLGEIATVTGGHLHLADPSVKVCGPVVVDNRQIGPGGLFAAFVGEHLDGHKFAQAAVDAGAVAVLGSQPTTVPTVVVDDVQAALGALAREVLRRRRALTTNFTVIAVTGSQGKTSTKDLLAAVLADAGETVATAGSFNNEIGLPLTVLRTHEDTRFLLLEMGARGIGHIAELATIAAPDISVVLNVGVAHLGEFGTQAAIAQAKGELVDALGPGGVAVLNADDAHVVAMSQRAEQALTFGSAADASVRWSELSTDDVGCPRFNLSFQGRTAHVRLRLIGAHHCANGAAAATAALAAGIDFDRVIESLQSVTSISKWRMELTEPVAGIRIINDAYNANPDSMRAALEALAQMGARSGHRTVAVLGEMRELGESALAEHQGIGRLAHDLGIDTVVVVGDQADGIAQMCQTPRRARGVEHAVELVREDIGSAPAIVLVKASRGAALERVVDQLTDQLRQEQA